MVRERTNSAKRNLKELHMKRPKTAEVINGTSNMVEETLPDIVDPENFGKLEFYASFLEDEKKFSKLIKKIEIQIRRSPELKYYIQYLKDELDLGKCFFFKNVSNDDVSIELHHYPFSLYDITEIVTKHAIRNSSEFFTTFSIAEKVVALHYENIIGLVPLSITLHQMAHAGDIYIPIGSVFGDIKVFINRYKEFIKGELIQKIEEVMITPNAEANRLNSKLIESITFKYKEDNKLNQSELIKLIAEISSTQQQLTEKKD